MTITAPMLVAAGSGMRIAARLQPVAGAAKYSQHQSI
jgi:hypothetical protein